MSIETWEEYFVAVEDPRCSGKVKHRLVEVSMIAVGAVIACAENWDDIALNGRSKLAWLRTFLELANGIPSHDTSRRVVMLIDLDAFEAGFAKWVGSLADRFKREVVAIDGRTVRRSFDHGREQSPLHVVSAWPSKQGLVMGQRCVDGKSNEITAVPELALKNSIVTLDAIGCQTAPQTLRVSANLPRRSSHAGETTCSRSNTILRWRTRPSPSTSTSAASASAHRTGLTATRLTRRTARWSGAGCLPAPMMWRLTPWAADRACASCSRWKASTASTARPPRSRLKSAAPCGATLTTPTKRNRNLQCMVGHRRRG